MARPQYDDPRLRQIPGLTFPILNGQKYVCDGSRCVRLPTKYEMYMAKERAASKSERIRRTNWEEEV
nr:unnamed protein product [Spirometra erinaceieuropaei]